MAKTPLIQITEVRIQSVVIEGHVLIGVARRQPGLRGTALPMPWIGQNPFRQQGAIPRARLGDLHVLNPGGDGGIPSTLQWSPLDGCQSPAIAIERAGYLMAAAPKDSGGKDAWWDAKGAELLRLMLHAAAISGATMHEAVAWVQRSSLPMALDGRVER